MKHDRRRFLSLAAEGLLFGAVVSLIPSCSKKEKEEEGGLPELPGVPEGVRVDLANKHTPRCILEDGGEEWILHVRVPHVVNPRHYIKGVKIAGPGPAFAPVASHEYPEAYIAKAEDGEWKHEFRFPKKRVPEGARHLVVWSHCNKHGDYGMTQAV